jgi:hypothetical protein
MLRAPHRKLALIAVLFAASTAATMLSASPAHAQRRGGYWAPPPPYYPRFEREGLVLGFGLGVGLVSASDCGDLCGAAFAGEVHIGGMLNPRTALMFDGWTNIHPIPNTDGQTTSTILAGALQFWLNDIFWLKGGLGLGNTQVTSSSAGTIGDATGFAIMGAGGVELVHYWTFALDLQLRLAHTFHPASEGGSVDDVAFMVGFNWY